MSASRNSQFFYQFLGAHSLLIGLLPFFLPVYLWNHGLNLAGLSILVGVSGTAFCASLKCWQLLAASRSLSTMIVVTFVLEIALVIVAGLFTTMPGAALYKPTPDPDTYVSSSILIAALVIGTFNGIYNAFFWTTQRTLFLTQIGNNDTGRRYGNLQLFVSLFLKMGILLGGFLLDHGGFIWLLALSAVTGALASGYLARTAYSKQVLLTSNTRVNLQQSLQFKDRYGSRSMFYLDGIFLYLESHFWTLSLFLVVRQDYSRLGIAVVALAVIFAALFFVVKNRIDRVSILTVFKLAVWLYAASWILRFGLNEQSTGGTLLVVLILITFCSSFFRLALNKLFFDIARRTQSVNYLLMKSYTSQCILGLFFLFQGALLALFGIETSTSLSVIYAGAALLALLYLAYAKSGH